MTTNNLIDESLLQSYSRKIFGFALSKTGHEQNAKDLSQEILLALYRSLQTGKQVDNMDAWVHTICCYTWSNYLAKEKRHWNHAHIDHMSSPNHGNTEFYPSDTEELLENLRLEIAYLSRLHRDITIHYYYERQSVEQIAQRLQIAAGTVKWHLFEVRKKLKEAIKMEQAADRLSYNPVRLMVGHSGTPGPNNEPNCYFNSMLISNICVAIYDKALTIEDIARKIGAASAYVEDELQKLEKSDLVRQVGKGKYQTNFIIETMHSLSTETDYFKSKAEELAEEIYECVAGNLEEIRALAFHGSHLNESFLLWTLIPYAIWNQYYQVKDEAYYVQYQPDERKDGGKYIVTASILYSDEEYRSSLPNHEIVRKYATNGIKTRNSQYHGGLQIESWWADMTWRDFNAPDLDDLSRVVELIESGAYHSEYDRIIISRLVEKGFVSMESGKLECLVPFFDATQHKALNRILDQAFSENNFKKKVDQIYEDMISLCRKDAPSFISDKEIVYKAMNDGMTLVFAVMEFLERMDILSVPADAEKKRLTTIVWQFPSSNE
jgi:RNA polymerase sigma factor (sigma-70 family)